MKYHQEDTKISNFRTSIDTFDMSIAFSETSSRSLSGVDIRNSGSQLFSLIETTENELGLHIQMHP